VLAILPALPGRADSAPDSLPPSSASYGTVKTQRIRFDNTPLFKKANEAVARRDDAAAIDYFQAILKNDPGDNRAKLALISLYERAGRYDDGIILCDELIRHYPDYAEAYFSKGQLAMQGKQYDLAAAAWSEGLKKAPPSFSRRREMLAALGLAYKRAGNFDDAAAAYEQALALAFDAPCALEYYYTLKAMGEPEKGRGLLERVLAGAPPPAARREALYELAQIDRRAGHMPQYFARMETLLREESDARRLYEYALQLHSAGRADLALKAMEKGFGLERDPQKKIRMAVFTAGLFTEQRLPGEARVWLQKAAELGGADAGVALALAHADYIAGDYRACADRLINMPERPPAATLLLGFAFMKRELPGLALTYLEEIRNLEELTQEERLNLFRNRAFLNFDQGRYAQALADAGTAMDLEPSVDMALLHLRALANISGGNEPEKEAEYFLNPTESGLNLTGAEKARVLEVMGFSLNRQGKYDEAVERLTEAVALDPSLAQAYFLRGVAYHTLGKSGEAVTNYLSYLSQEQNPPAMFWGDLGQAAGKHREYEQGTDAFRKSLQYHSVDVATLSDQGYQFMKWNHNREAKESFRRAIDFYADLVPRVPTNETASYRRNELAMKTEYTKLDRLFGFQAYLSRTDYGFPTNLGISSVDGALPSQGGLELSFRPPLVGFRNEKTLEVFGDLMGNFKRQSWSPDPDSYQGMAGVRYKPLARINYNMSIARLMKIGDNSENNWLWRNLASWESGAKPPADKRLGFNARLFGDVGYYFSEHSRWYGFFDGRAGPAWKLSRSVFLTLPQAMGILRFETNDDAGTGSYAIAGLGGSLRLYEPERRYFLDRFYVDLFAYYTVGAFESTPAGFDGRTFDGPMIGLNFVK
jgi:tetratricopeptide (TPR) repeat protein